MGQFDNAAAVYACQQRSAISRHEVTHPEFRQYCRLLKRLDREPSSEDDVVWATFVRGLKRFRFRLLASPSSFGDPGVIDDAGERELASLASHASRLYPGQALVCQELVALLKVLRRRNEENPIL